MRLVVEAPGLCRALSYDQSIGTSDPKDWLIGATVPIGLGTVKVSYNKATISGAPTGVSGLGAASAKMLALGSVFDLSEPTALYTTAAGITNDANTQFTVGGQANGPSMHMNGQVLTARRRPATTSAFATASDPALLPGVAHDENLTTR